MANPIDQATVSLTLVAETCRVSVAALSKPFPSKSTTDLRVIRIDLLALLSLVYQSTTKLSLALSPSELAYKASISPLNELAQHVNALTSCASLFGSETHGQTLTSEVVGLVTDVLVSVSALVNTFLSIARSGPSCVPEGEYLTRAGTVHSLIDKARGANGLSTDNLQAVRKIWAQDRKTLDDAYAELSDMMENEDDIDESFSDDEDLAELGLDPSKKLNSDEIERTKKVQPFIRLITLLHKRILVDLLTASTLPVSPTPLDELTKMSANILAATDDVVATLYGPQDPSSIPPALSALSRLIHALRKHLLDNSFIPPKQSLEKQLESTTIKGGEQNKDVSRWFDTCFTQIDKLCISLSESFNKD